MILEFLGFHNMWGTEKIYLDNLRRSQNGSKQPPPPAPPSVTPATASNKRKTQNNGPINIGAPTKTSLDFKRGELRSCTAVTGTEVDFDFEQPMPSVFDPKEFFINDDIDDSVPCSCRVVTSTQKSPTENNGGYEALASLSPIGPAPRKSIHAPDPQSQSDQTTEPIALFTETVESPSPTKNKRKRSPMFEASDDENEAENGKKAKKPPSPDATTKVSGDEVEKQSSSESLQNKARSLLSRFRRVDKD